MINTTTYAGIVIGGTTYATWNPADTSAGFTLSNGNLTYTYNTSGWTSLRATIGVSSGKWYWEFTPTVGIYFAPGIGLSTATLASYPGSNASSMMYYNDGTKYVNSAPASYGAAYVVGDVIGTALDMDIGTVTFFKNGVSQGVAFTGLVGTYYPMNAVGTVGGAGVTNFGLTALVYAPPVGYNAGFFINIPSHGVDIVEDFIFSAVTSDGPLSATALSIANSIFGRSSDINIDSSNLVITSDGPLSSTALSIANSIFGRSSDSIKDIILTIPSVSTGGPSFSQRWA